MLKYLYFSMLFIISGCYSNAQEIDVNSANWIDHYEIFNGVKNLLNNQDNKKIDEIFYNRRNFIVNAKIKNESEICRKIEHWAKSNLLDKKIKSYRFFYNHDEMTLKNNSFYNDFDYLITDNLLCEMNENLKCYSCNKEVN